VENAPQERPLAVIRPAADNASDPCTVKLRLTQNCCVDLVWVVHKHSHDLELKSGPERIARPAELVELGDPYFELDRDWRIVGANRNLESIAHRPRSEILNRLFSEVWPEAAVPDSPYLQHYHQCMQERVAVRFEAYFAPWNLWTGVTAYPISTGGIAIFLRDISAAKGAEEALGQSRLELEAERLRLQTIIDTIPTGLIMLNEHGAMEIENAEWKRTWGGNAILNGVVDYAKYKGFRPETGEQLAPEDWPCAISLKQGVPTNDVILDIERFNGTRGTIVVSSAPIRDSSGRVVAAVAANMDISELRAAQARLQEADVRKNEFLAMLAHELRNPLAPIRTSIYILDRADASGPQARRAREVISRQVTHLSKLVDDLLDVTRIGHGKIELRRTEVDLTALARRTAEDYAALMHELGVELVVAVGDEALVVDGDETRLAQTLGNLLSNAAKFTPQGGAVTLELRERDGRAVVCVRDTGVGIEPDLLPTIFDPFTQAQQNLARTQGGLGLGLALVKGLVELHGGSVTVTSTPAVGSEFTVDLPLAHAAERTCSDPAATPLASRSHRVLVVDDNVDAANSLSELLRVFGHEVQVTYDGPNAVAMVQSGAYDLVLCDIGLPGMNGYEVARTVRPELGGKTRLVAISGYAQDEDVRKSLEAGFDGHMAKPPDLQAIERLFSGGGG
jgi:signal transduction histidine kinase